MIFLYSSREKSNYANFFYLNTIISDWNHLSFLILFLVLTISFSSWNVYQVLGKLLLPPLAVLQLSPRNDGYDLNLYLRWLSLVCNYICSFSMFIACRLFLASIYLIGRGNFREVFTCNIHAQGSLAPSLGSYCPSIYVFFLPKIHPFLSK